MAELKFKVTCRLNEHQYIAVLEFTGSIPEELSSMPLLNLVASPSRECLPPTNTIFTATLVDTPVPTPVIQAAQTHHSSINQNGSQTVDLPVNHAANTSSHIYVPSTLASHEGDLKLIIHRETDAQFTSAQDISCHDIIEVDTCRIDSEMGDTISESDFTELDLSENNTASDDQCMPLSGCSTVAFTDKTLATDIAKLRDVCSETSVDQALSPIVCIQSSLTDKVPSSSQHDSAIETSSTTLHSSSIMPPSVQSPNKTVSPDLNRPSTSGEGNLYQTPNGQSAPRDSTTATTPRKTHPIADLVPVSKNWQWPVCGRLLTRTDVMKSRNGCPFFKGKLMEYAPTAPPSAIELLCFGSDTDIFHPQLKAGGVYCIYDALIRKQNPRFDRNSAHPYEMVLREKSGTIVETCIDVPESVRTVNDSPPVAHASESGSDSDGSDEIVQTSSTKKRTRIVESDDASDEEASSIPAIKRNRSVRKSSQKPGISRKKSPVDGGDSGDDFIVEVGENGSGEDDEYHPNTQEMKDCYIVNNRPGTRSNTTKNGKKNANVAHKRRLFDENDEQQKKRHFSRIKSALESSLETNDTNAEDSDDDFTKDDGIDDAHRDDSTSDSGSEGTGSGSTGSHSDSGDTSASSSEQDVGQFWDTGLADQAKRLTPDQKEQLRCERYFAGFLSLVDMMLAEVLEPGHLESMYAATQNEDTKHLQDSIYALQGFVTSRLALCFSQAWCKPYKAAVETCPNVRSVRGRPAVLDIHELVDCQACNRQRRHWAEELEFDGHPYHKQTFQRLLEPEDDDDDDDERFSFLVGCYCVKRSRIYHSLFHWQYKVYQVCKATLERVRPRFPANATTETLVKACMKYKDLWLMKYHNLKTLLHAAEQDFSEDAKKFQFF